MAVISRGFVQAQRNRRYNLNKCGGNRRLSVILMDRAETVARCGRLLDRMQLR